ELNVNLRRLVTDSREVMDGDTFVAYPGERADGRQYIPAAIAKGANAVLWDTHNFTWNPAWQLPNLGIADLRHQAGWLADAIYGAPSDELWVVGITGTNGKTSTCHWLAQALSENAKHCAVIGTLGNGFPGSLRATINTTPDAIRVHGLLAEYLKDDARAVAMEVSSHALAQGRVNGVRFDAALLTNLSRDHLDYHGDMESYAGSKRKLFAWEQLKYAVLNLDDVFGADLAEQLQSEPVEVIGYGIGDAAIKLAERLGIRMVYGHLLEMNGRGMKLEIHSSWGKALLNSQMIGRFNASNLLGVLASLLVAELPLDRAVKALQGVKPVAGRMQRFGNAQQPSVIVDYAHTPDALEKVLLTLRELGQTAANLDSKLICVFGCGGERDQGKRAMMGRVAERFADYCIVTSDNPRGEDPIAIIDEVVGAMSADNHRIVVDRGVAIRSAISMSKLSDTVLVAGKGHEDYQEIAGIRYPFSDAVVVQQELQAWSARSGS
ncbi:MAG: UDP-N-acetylmuramoyl-L-alanyl-D-glutamate--2,6-diaminopimelate ligase, partial [Gallionella sp.]